VATKKTTPSEKAKTGAAKPRAAAAKKATSSKSDPVILDPPAKKATAAKKPAVVIEAKAEDVTKPSPVKMPDTPKEKARPAPEKSPEPVVAKPQASTSTRAFAGFLAGGAVAALIGYFAAGYINPPPVAVDNSDQIATLTAKYDAKITLLEGQISDVTTAPKPQANVDLTVLQGALDKQAARLAQTEAKLTQALADLKALRGEKAKAPSSSGGGVSSATTALIKQYGDEIATLKAQVEAQGVDMTDLSDRMETVSAIASHTIAEAQAKVDELTKNVANSAKSVDLALAKERLIAAVESGKTYGALLSQVADETGANIPAALTETAATGVATLEQLRKDFPAAARRALKTSLQTEAGGGLTDKLTAYLKAQVGARSLEEREGDDPDAILSRIEGALSRGELAAAVEQAQQLPASGLVELSDWLAAAEIRLKVEAALQELSSAIDGSE
jgi:hypothetical protein